MNRNIVERISTHCSAFVNRLTCKINSILLLLCNSLIENFGDLSGKERFPHVQIICKYASTSRWRWQHWSSDLHSDPQGRRKVGGVSSNVVGTICPPVEIELTDLSQFGSGCMTSQPSGSDSPDVAAVLCWLDYWADQPRRRKNVHNFKEDQLVLYSTVKYNCRVKIAFTLITKKLLVWELSLQKHFGKAIFHCVWAKRRSH